MGVQRENNENHENLRMPRENKATHENHKISHQNPEQKKQKIIELHKRIMKIKNNKEFH